MRNTLAEVKIGFTNSVRMRSTSWLTYLGINGMRKRYDLTVSRSTPGGLSSRRCKTVISFTARFWRGRRSRRPSRQRRPLPSETNIVRCWSGRSRPAWFSSRLNPRQAGDLYIASGVRKRSLFSGDRFARVNVMLGEI